MTSKNKVLGSLISLGLLMGIASGATATEMEMPANQTNQFRRIEQPFGLKLGVTLGGAALIGAEVWWFLFKKRKVQQATFQEGIQELTITVDGGYQPDYIVVQAGQLVRLNFFRKDANSCLEEVLFPDFGIDAHLPLNKTTPIQFTPQKPGEYQFTCGMRMYRGVVAVQASDTEGSPVVPVYQQQPLQMPVTVTESVREPQGKVQSAQLLDDIQELTITVEGGYKPARIAVQAGKPVRLNFFRKDPNGCLSQVLLPDFGIAADLPLNETTSIEFTPQKVGEYPFTCGMKMFRGVVEVR